MSMHETQIYGYGFPCLFSDDAFYDFVKNHKDTFCHSDVENQLFNDIMKQTDDYDVLCENYASHVSDECGVGSVIANIMERETGILFEYRPNNSDCDTDASILLAEGMPYQFNDTEKALTKDKLKEVIVKYMTELKMDITTYPSELCLSYFG